MQFITVITQKEGKWYVARSAELGVVSQGKTVAEAQKNLQEAVELYLEDNPESKKYFRKDAPFVTTLHLNN